MKFKNKKTVINPLVSVIMPVYNAAEFLVEAIESILNQSYRNFEFLIVDDGSTDDSWKIIKKYQNKFPKLLKTFRLKKNINAAGNGAVNAVLPEAKGEFIARMDADDVAHPQRLEKQVNFLLEHPEIILVGTQAKVIDPKGKTIGKKSYPLVHEEIYKKYAEVHPIIHPSCMIQRTLLPNGNRLYEMRCGVNDDYYTFFRLLNYGKFANLPEYLLSYRIHKDNSSLKNLKEKYANISKIRKLAQEKFGYKVSLKAKALILLQDVLVNFIPEEMLVTVYLFIRGINAGISPLDLVRKKISLAFAKVNHYALSLS